MEDKKQKYFDLPSVERYVRFKEFQPDVCSWGEKSNFRRGM